MFVTSCSDGWDDVREVSLQGGGEGVGIEWGLKRWQTFLSICSFMSSRCMPILKICPSTSLKHKYEDVCPSLVHPDRFNLTSLKSVLVAYFDKLSIVCYIDHINIICLKIVHCIFLCSLHKSSGPVQTDVYLSGSNSPVFLASPM